MQLETLCITNEARRSLHVWQQNYARQSRRPALLPCGGTMDEQKGLVNRLFGGRKTSAPERQSSLKNGETMPVTAWNGRSDRLG